MQKVSLEVEMDLSHYDTHVQSLIARYLQDMDMYLWMNGVQDVQFTYWDIERV